MRVSVVLLITLGVTVAALAMPRIGTGAAGSPRAYTFGIMAMAGIALVFLLAGEFLSRRERSGRVH